MNSQFNRLNVVASKVSTVTADLQHLNALGNGTYAAVISLSSNKPTQQDIHDAVSDLLDNKVKVVAGTEKRLTDYGNLWNVFVVANTPSMDYGQAANMKLVAANLFSDGESNLWKVVGEGDDRRLVQTSNDNLDEILSSRLSKRLVTASYKMYTEVATGDYALFFNKNTGTLDSGFIVTTEDNKIVAFSLATKEIEELNPKSVVEAVIGYDIKDHPFDKGHMETAINKDALGKYLDYMKKLYAGTDFYAQMEKNIKQRTGIGEKGLYMPTLSEGK